MIDTQYICDVHGILDDEDEPEDSLLELYGDDIFCVLCMRDMFLKLGLKPVKVKEGV